MFFVLIFILKYITLNIVLLIGFFGAPLIFCPLKQVSPYPHLPYSGLSPAPGSALDTKGPKRSITWIIQSLKKSRRASFLMNSMLLINNTLHLHCTLHSFYLKTKCNISLTSFGPQTPCEARMTCTFYSHLMEEVWEKRSFSCKTTPLEQATLQAAVGQWL